MVKKYIGSVLLFLFVTCNIYTQGFEIVSDNQKTSITHKLKYLGDKDFKDLNIQNFENALNDLSKLPFTNQTLLEPKKWHWSYIEIQNSIDNNIKINDWIFEFNQLVTHAQIFATYENGELDQHITGLFVPNKEKTTHHTFRSSICKINIPQDEQVKLYIGLFSDRKSIDVNPSVTIESYRHYTQSLSDWKYLNGIFLGFILLMATYNFALFLLNYDKAYLYYAIYLTAICFFSIYKSGTLADDFFNKLFAENPQWNYLGKYFGYVMLVAYLNFLHYFLDLKNFMPLWDKIISYTAWLALPLIIIDFILLLTSNFSPAVSDIPAMIFAFTIVLVSFIFCYQLYKKKNVKGYFILSGLAAMSLGLLVMAIHRLFTVEFTLTAFKIGSLIEILLFSLGLVYRQREREKEKQLTELNLEKAKFLQEQEHKETERLKELDQLKSKFYSNITHEFRTPLSVIIGMSDQIGDSKTKSLIQRNANNLLRLISQILDLSKVESDKESINYIKNDFVNYISFLTESFYSSAKSKNIKLEFISSLRELNIYFDEQKIQQIVYNLISNALKYSSSNGSITIQLSSTDENKNIRLCIEDNGIGIAKENLPFVFDRYYQAEGSDGHIYHGTGIGLALTRELVNLMGGQISIASEPEVGTKVIVCLPMIHELPKSKTSIVSNSQTEFQNYATSPELLSNNEVILIVEDNEDVAFFIQSILNDNYTCLIAENGELGVEKALKIIPDIIISDVMMPKLDGFKLVEKLKSDILTSHIPIILLTAKVDFDSKMMGLKYGADAYISKPFSKEEILIRIENMLRLIKGNQKMYSSIEVNDVLKEGESPKEKLVNDLDLQLINKLKSFIEANISNENFGVSDITNHLNLSKSQLFRKLKGLIGLTPGKLIKQMRLDEAKKLISQTDLPIKTIAYNVGFSDPNYFSRVYKQHFGESPKSGAN